MLRNRRMNQTPLTSTSPFTLNPLSAERLLLPAREVACRSLYALARAYVALGGSTRSLPPSRERTAFCYRYLDSTSVQVGESEEFTEGYYARPNISYEEAKRLQFEYILDAVGCGPGTTLLDVGCGNGNLLALAKARGARTYGITISHEQVRMCRERGLDVRHCAINDLASEADLPRFDAVVMNGSLEHFATSEDAVAGRETEVYAGIFRGLFAATAPGAKVLTTCIHVLDRPDPADVIAPPWAHEFESASWHWSVLNLFYGGWYPAIGQLARSAHSLFTVSAERNATHDYYLTSLEWRRRRNRSVAATRMKLEAFLEGVQFDPRYAANTLVYHLSRSWLWQFTPRADGTTPTRHLWTTWTRA